MKQLAGLCISILALVACGGGGSDPDAAPNVDADTTDAADNPDAAPDPDATPCTKDVECAGRADGDMLCMANSLVTCNLEDGCLAATVVDCAADMCVDDGTPACEANGDGESCASVMVITANTIIAGADFTADYTDDQDFTDVTCEEGASADLNVEAVFSVNLLAHQRITVSETGDLDAILGIQTTCGNTEACLVASDTPDSVTYLADAATTLFIYVGSYFDDPGSTDYSIEFEFTECGDGILDDAEECDDDGFAAADGCSSTCLIEFGFTCNTTVDPTDCDPLPTLGTVGDGDAVNENPGPGTLVAAGDSVFYTITFTEPVEVTGTLAANSTGDPDLEIFTVTQFLYDLDAGGTEDFTTSPLYFPPGTYVFRIIAFSELTTGFTLDMAVAGAPHTNLGTFAAGVTIPDMVQSAGMLDGEIERYTITFTAPVLLSGTLAADPSGDLDLYGWRTGDFVFIEDAIGDEAFTDRELPADTYYLEVVAFDDVDGYTVSLSTTAVP